MITVVVTVTPNNLVVYAERLNKENPGIVEWLIEQSHTVVSPTRNELKELL